MRLSVFKKTVENRYNTLTVKYPRLLFFRSEIKSGKFPRKPLTSSQKKEIRKFWAPFTHLGSSSWGWFEFYNAIHNSPADLKYFIPQGIYHTDVDMHFSHTYNSMAIDDKNLYSLLMAEARQPETVCRRLKPCACVEDTNYAKDVLDRFIELRGK